MALRDNATQSYAKGAAAAEPTNNAMTLSCWVLPRTLTGTQQIVYKAYRIADGWTSPYESIAIVYGYPTGSTINAYISSGGSGYSAAANVRDTIMNGKWSHVGMTYDGSNIRLWHDGLNVATTARSGTIDYGTSGYWAIGSVWATGFNQTFQGRIADVRVYSNVKTDAWWTNEYRQGLGLY
jgi:hypothetical protein